jgi:hypothetical protein
MNTLTKLKLTQRLKSSLFEYCNVFFTQNKRYPTVSELNETFNIPNFLDVNIDNVVSESIVSGISSCLTEAVLARPRARSRGGRRIEIETEAGKIGSRGGRVVDVTPEMIDVFNTGKTPESMGVNSVDFLKGMTPSEFMEYQSKRQQAIDAGEPVTELDLQIGVRTPQTPDSKPAAQEDSAKNADRQAVAWASERLGQIKRGEVEDPNPMDSVITAIDSIVNWAKGAVETPTQEPTEVPTKTPDEIPTKIPVEIPTETPVEEPTETPTQEPVEEPTEEPTEDEFRSAPLMDPGLAPSVIPFVSPITDPKTDPDQDTELERRVRTGTSTRIRTRPETDIDPLTRDETEVDPRNRVDPTIKPAVKTPKKDVVDPRRIIPTSGAASGSSKKPESSEVKDDGEEPGPTPTGIDLERYSALRAGLQGVKIINEGVYDPKRSLQKKEKKQKFKVVVTKEGGKKVEIFAGSLRGVKRVIFGKQNFRVFNQSGTDMTSYFKKAQKRKN